jgi:hypothetical protein
MRTTKDQDRKQKIQNSLVFSQNDVWDTVMFILDETIKQETSLAINQNIEEEKRSHQAGRADGIVYFKELIEDTRAMALKLKDRDGS